MKKLFNSMLVLSALIALVACGGEASPTSAPATDSNTTAPATGGTSTLTVDSADGATMAYAQTSLEATAGTVTITFNNKGVLPHNLTITKEADAETANNAAMSAAPDYKAPGALAQTKLLNSAGETDTVTANLEAGTYTYFCTFPGHFASGMKGTLVVK